MGGTRRLGYGRFAWLSPQQQIAEKLLFRQQTQILNEILSSDKHYLPLYKRRTWSTPADSKRFHRDRADSKDPTFLALTLPSPRRTSCYDMAPVQDIKANQNSSYKSSSFDEDNAATRLRNSRSHGHRLHCEVLGKEACHKCLQVLDQAALANSCPICLSSTKVHDKVPFYVTEFMSRDTLIEQRNRTSKCSAATNRHSPVQIFNRVRHGGVKVTNFNARQGKQPLALKFFEERKQSGLPSQLTQRKDSQDSLNQSEDLSPKNYELKVQVTFGNGTKLNCT
ncbi:hypothetical protein ElyMa_001849800 [Elysia marginata]|uniref:Uncharacterized protein n=1 Tax=Elysia marginata TaxID=1093978 RepID=A0AAV4ELX8_9GAST|nr:hypothetical protein ElyMa_001849800 [Elysia marginata]